MRSIEERYQESEQSDTREILIDIVKLILIILIFKP